MRVCFAAQRAAMTLRLCAFFISILCGQVWAPSGISASSHVYKLFPWADGRLRSRLPSVASSFFWHLQLSCRGSIYPLTRSLLTSIPFRASSAHMPIWHTQLHLTGYILWKSKPLKIVYEVIVLTIYIVFPVHWILLHFRDKQM